jgi:hypothetical protein
VCIEVICTLFTQIVNYTAPETGFSLLLRSARDSAVGDPTLACVV